MRSYSPFRELFLARMREFYREPAAVFWTYGFPILLTAGLGLAFRNKAPEQIHVGLADSAEVAQLATALDADERFIVESASATECARLLRVGRIDIMVSFDDEAGAYEYRFDPTQPEAVRARLLLDDTLQRSAGREDVLQVAEVQVTEPGSRYIDFLVPGLIGMNLMGGGLWGIGFVTVDMRIRKLLKRLVATPMRRRDLLLSIISGRMVFTVPEMTILLFVAWLMFKIPFAGSLLSFAVVAAVGALSFAGIGLLVASRAQKLETISGLMNLVMLPMWLCSGVFFSSERFPAALQPVIQALPLTQLNNALRAVMLEGSGLGSQWMRLSILTAWGVVSFLLALKWFRWT